MPLQFLSEIGLIGFLLYGAILGGGDRRAAPRADTRVPCLSLAVAVCVLHSYVDIDWDYVAVQGPLFLVVGALCPRRPS